mmetsp:Transcript_116146/g.324834  ORF Transcript_116146/g.324834 Transcript_116146/m.324834 type:complete len:295 (+) Transcript_116146:933-1817(+)
MEPPPRRRPPLPQDRGAARARPRAGLGHARAHGHPRHHEGDAAAADGRPQGQGVLRLQDRGADLGPRRGPELRPRVPPRVAAVLRGPPQGAAGERQVHSLQAGLQHGLARAGGGLARRALPHLPEGGDLGAGLEPGHRLLLRALVHRPGGRRAHTAERLREVRAPLSAACALAVHGVLQLCAGLVPDEHRDAGPGGLPRRLLGAGAALARPRPRGPGRRGQDEAAAHGAGRRCDPHAAVRGPLPGGPARARGGDGDHRLQGPGVQAGQLHRGKRAGDLALLLARSTAEDGLQGS